MGTRLLSVPEGPSTPRPASRRSNNLPPDMDDYATYVSPEPTPPPQPQRRPRERFAEAVGAAGGGREVTGRTRSRRRRRRRRRVDAFAEAAKIAELQG